MSTILKKKELVKDFNKYLKNRTSNTTFNDDFEIYLKNVHAQNFLDMSADNYSHTNIDYYKELLSIVESDNVFEKKLNEIYNADVNLKKLGAEIKKLRVAQGWSTHKLADLSQMSLGFISQLENGKSSMPKASNLTRLAKIFNVDPNNFLYLAGYIDKKPTVDFDWKISIKNQLSSIGINREYINEIIDYIETVQVKQSLQEKRGK